MKFVNYLLLLLLAFPGFAFASQSASVDLLLSGNDIDLLVGTPVGIVEPLDQRRTKYVASNNQDFSGFLEDDLQSDISFAELDWSDAEDRQPSEDETESQMLDLLSETDELENSDMKKNENLSATDDAISLDYIESDLKL